MEPGRGENHQYGRALDLEMGFDMVTYFLRKLWVHLSIALNPMVTPEGFEMTGKPFVLLSNSWELEPATKRRLTICNLFINQRQSITAIAHLLDTSKGKVVDVLIEERFIKERRYSRQRHVRRERRRTFRTNAAPSLAPRLVGAVPTSPKSITGPSPRFQTLIRT